MIIVGAGIAGTFAAHKLCHAGVKALMLDSRSNSDFNKARKKYYAVTFKTPDSTWPNHQKFAREQLQPIDQRGSWKQNPKRHWHQTGPFKYDSIYERSVGSTMNHWLGTCLRFAPDDFRLKKKIQG